MRVSSYILTSLQFFPNSNSFGVFSHSKGFEAELLSESSCCASPTCVVPFHSHQVHMSQQDFPHKHVVLGMILKKVKQSTIRIFQ